MVQRIVILRALPGLGDFLCAIPALRALRTAFLHDHIALIGMAQTQGLVARFSLCIDELIEFPGFPGLPEQPFRIEHFPSFLSSMHKRNFDLALQMHGSGAISNQFIMLIGARRTAGFFPPEQYCPDENSFLPYHDREHEVLRHLRLMELLGVPAQGQQMEFPLNEEDWQALRAIPEANGLRPGEYVCIHPGSSTTARRWPIADFVGVADRLAARGLQVVLTGSQAETHLGHDVISSIRAPALNLIGRTSLGALAALLSRARLLISSDTGVCHLGAAIHTPSVIVFVTTELDRWAPLDRERHRSVYKPNQLITVADVLVQADALLDEPWLPGSALATNLPCRLDEAI